jgi:hypothetical protein
MKIFFDQGTPVPLRRALLAHTVSTAFEMGWSDRENGTLLDAAEGSFDAFVTTDQNLRYQQNRSGRRLAILVLMTTSWPVIRQNLPDVVAAINGLKPGDYVELRFDRP